MSSMKKAGETDCHWITYTKESGKDPEITTNFPHCAFFGWLGECLSWRCVNAPHIGNLGPSLLAAVLWHLSLDIQFRLRRGERRQHTASLVLQIFVQCLWQMFSCYEGIWPSLKIWNFFNVMPRHQKQQQGLPVIFIYLKMQILAWTNQ